MIQFISNNHSQAGINKNQEISRVLSAAVINNRFRSMLLDYPRSAVVSGYFGEKFSLENEMIQKLGSIHSGNLADFAAQLTTL
jgi:hypothetical protein